MNFILWNEVLIKPPEYPTITFFDTGKSDAIFIELPDGRNMLIDGGASGKFSGRCQGRNIVSPYLIQRGIRSIDCVVLTHDHEDHIGGLLYIAEEFNIGSIIEGEGVTPDKNEKSLYHDFEQIIKNRNIKRLKVNAGDFIKGFKETEFLVLNPAIDIYEDANNDSIVLNAEFADNHKVLFCGDIEEDAVTGLLRYGSRINADIIKVPHHGGIVAKSLCYERLLHSAGIKKAVITNEKAKVSKKARDILYKNKTEYYITGECGAVIVEIREDELKIQGYLLRDEV